MCGGLCHLFIQLLTSPWTQFLMMPSLSYTSDTIKSDLFLTFLQKFHIYKESIIAAAQSRCGKFSQSLNSIFHNFSTISMAGFMQKIKIISDLCLNTITRHLKALKRLPFIMCMSLWASTNTNIESCGDFLNNVVQARKWEWT